MTKQEQELLIMMEECSELSEQCSKFAVRISKSLRFGLDEIQPEQELTNAERLTQEYADIIALFEIIADDENNIVIYPSRTQIEAKKEKLNSFFEYSKKCGTID